MTPTQQKKILREHYGLDRPVTDEELRAELISLKRRIKKRSVYDEDMQLIVKLEIHPVTGE